MQSKMFIIQKIQSCEKINVENFIMGNFYAKNWLIKIEFLIQKLRNGDFMMIKSAGYNYLKRNNIFLMNVHYICYNIG